MTLILKKKHNHYDELSPEEKQGIDKSLDYLVFLYMLRKEYRNDRIKFKKYLTVLHILQKAKTKVEYELGKVSTEKILRYSYLKEFKHPLNRSESEENELNNFNRYYFKLNINKRFYELINEVQSTIYSNPSYNPFIPVLPDLDCFLPLIPKLRIDPVKLLYHIWHKAFRKGSYGNIELVESLILEFKQKTQNTEKELLFKSICNDTNFESLRKKSKYGLKQYYVDLISHIFNQCF